MSLDQPADFVKHQTVTRDAFLGGRLTLSQPAKGFRAGLDSVLLGAAVPAGTKSVLDLGAGVGTAGLVALAMGRADQVILAERDEETVRLARQNIADNGLGERAEVIAVDVTASGAARRAAGLADNGYSAVIANPPYFASGQGTLASMPSRADARHMAVSELELWARCAASAAMAGGLVTFVYPAPGLGALLAALEPRFGGLTILPLSPRPGAAATRVLIRGVKGSRAPLTLLATRNMHGVEGNGFAPEFDAILKGTAVLDW
jgi:tRNA1(Val) A37 N6-methylase TrmN6